MSFIQRPVSIVVSDLHMGAADAYDDFVYQKDEFVNFVDELTASPEGRQGRIELLINGDFLELAQVNPDAYRLGSSEFWCSQRESLSKLEPIVTGHAKVFAAINRFHEARNQCTLFAGNHDVELYWADVQARLTAAAGALRFELGEVWYSRYGGALRLSHGHMFDPGNRFEKWEYPFKLAKDGLRLEMCAGTMFMVKFVNWMEEKYPFADNIHPNWRLATILWKEAKDGLALAAWLFVRFAARHPRFTLGGDDDAPMPHTSKMGDWVVSLLQSSEPFRVKVTTLWNEVYGVSLMPGDVVARLHDADKLEQFMADVVVRVSPDRWLPVFDGVRPATLQIAESGRWKAKESLRSEATHQFGNEVVQIVTIGHTHEYDSFNDGAQRYYNTGSWTRSLPWSKEQDLTLDKLKEESWFPYNLLYLRVEQQADGTLASQMGTRGTSA